MSQIEIGSVVRLKSGGPAMTVEAYGTKLEGKGFTMKNVDDTDKVVCQWFEGNKLQNATFPTSSLKAEEDAPPTIEYGSYV